MNENFEPTAGVEANQIQQAVSHLLDDATAVTGERRCETRETFFGPVTVVVEEDGQRRSYSCFSRDLSSRGMGLLHNMPLEPGQVLLTIRRESNEVRFKSEISWCRPCGEGWYLSGAKLLAVLPAS